jgi:putative transposase
VVLLAHVRSAFKLSNDTYGSPRMTRELQDEGHAVGRRRTARLMRENGLVARQKRRFKAHHRQRAFLASGAEPARSGVEAEGPNQKWGVDISYIWTREGWLYLSVVLDLFSRRVVGCTTSDRLHRLWPYLPSERRSSCVSRRPV